MRRYLILFPGLLVVVSALVWVSATEAQDIDRDKREHRLPCNGVVSLYYGDELIWTRGPDEIRKMKELVAVPHELKSGVSGLQLVSLLTLKPDIAAIELESCQPRLRRFESTELRSEHGAALYLVATNYRGFRLRNVSRNRGGGGGGMKNIGRIVLVPATAGDTDQQSSDEKGERRGRGTGSGKGTRQDSAKESEKN